MLYNPETRAWLYGGVVAGYLLSICLCDRLKLELWMSVICIFAGAGPLWYLYPSSRSSTDHRTFPPEQQEPTTLFSTDLSCGSDMGDIVDQLGLQEARVVAEHTNAEEDNKHDDKGCSQCRSPHQPLVTNDENMQRPLVSSLNEQQKNQEAEDIIFLDVMNRTTTLAAAAEKNVLHQQRLCFGLVFTTHSAVTLGYFVFLGFQWITHRWLEDEKDNNAVAIKEWAGFGALACYALLALWGISHSWRSSNQGQWHHQQKRSQQTTGATDVEEFNEEEQRQHKDEILEKYEDIPVTDQKHNEYATETAGQYRLLHLNENCQQHLTHGQPQTSHRGMNRTIVKKPRKRGPGPLPTTVSLDMIESTSETLSTMSLVKQEMVVWALWLFFVMPSPTVTAVSIPKYPFPLFQYGDVHDDVLTIEKKKRLIAQDKGVMMREGARGRGHGDDNDALADNNNHKNHGHIHDGNNDTTMTAAVVMTNDDGQYERREQDQKKIKNNTDDDLQQQRVLTRRSTLQMSRGAILESSPSPIESTFSRLARMAADPERSLSTLFNYYRRQYVHTKGPPLSTSSSSPTTTGPSDTADVLEDSDDFRDLAFVVRSHTLPTVRVGLYGTSEKRLWSSSTRSMVNVTAVAAPESILTASTVTTTTITATAVEKEQEQDEDDEDDDIVLVDPVKEVEA
ncbi:hypothetical protein BGZ83_008798 [Gryganskiella cystojenkinii]|nr:hypothetical protein BGZ83_008798 [Gryganskiella cystojenkinii]